MAAIGLCTGVAVRVTNAADITITKCSFKRLDGNAIYLPGKSRDVTISQSSFEWLGENAVTTNGKSNSWDARGGEQPRGTLLTENIMHDLGPSSQNPLFARLGLCGAHS